MCENLLKAHVDSLDQQMHMKVDLDEVVEEFEGFLMVAYAMADRVNVKLIEKAVKENFGEQHAQALWSDVGISLFRSSRREKPA